MTEPEKQTVLRQYAAGELGTRRTIEALGLHNYADLVIFTRPAIFLANGSG